MRILFFTLGTLALICWIAGYIWISFLACAFSNQSHCNIPEPWALNTEDMIFMFLIPGVTTATLFAVGWLLGRRKMRGKSE